MHVNSIIVNTDDAFIRVNKRVHPAFDQINRQVRVANVDQIVRQCEGKTADATIGGVCEHPLITVRRSVCTLRKEF